MVRYRRPVRTIVRVTDRVQETPSTVTLRFPYAPPALPGQFVMVWFPGDDELPMSLSYTDGPSKGITVKVMGETSRHVQSVAPGTQVGIRGPYGNRFDLSPRRILVVAGGSGAAVLAPAAEAARAGGRGHGRPGRDAGLRTALSGPLPRDGGPGRGRDR